VPELKGEAEQEARRSHIVTFVGVVLLPIVLFLVFMATHFAGLESAEAMEQAQLARHLVEGRGFTTSVIRPLSLLYKPIVHGHPDLLNAPLYPLWEALIFRFGGTSDRLAALSSGICWLISVWLTFALGYRLWGRDVAVLATGLYALNLYVLKAATAGHSLSLLTVWVLVLCHCLPTEEETGRPWRAMASGILVGVCTLTRYTIFFSLLPPVLGGLRSLAEEKRSVPTLARPEETAQRMGLPSWREAWRGFFRRPSTKASGLFIGFLILTLAPWGMRNYRLTGNPFFNLGLYGILTESPKYPGESIYRLATPWIDAPATFVFQESRQFLRKVAAKLETLYRSVPALLNFYLLGLTLASLIRVPLPEEQEPPALHRLRRFLAWALGLHLLVVAISAEGVEAILPFVPVATLLAAGFFRDLVEVKFPANRPFVWNRMPRGVVLAGACWLLVGIASYPLGAFHLIQQPTLVNLCLPNLNYLADRVPPDGLVMSDSPGLVAWYAHRDCLWLSQEKGEFNQIDTTLGPIDALYFSVNLQNIPVSEWGNWWRWAYVSSEFGNLVGIPERVPGEVLLLRRNLEQKPSR
jgi:hypothetical protein